MLKNIKNPPSKLKTSTARKFSGGLNVVDSELNLNSKFARVLDNMNTGLDGSIGMRQGTKLYCDLDEISDGYLINGKYFAGNNIFVNNVGQVFAVDGAGNSVRIWDAATAAARRFGLQTWGFTTYAAFEEFGGELIIGNGQDKPLVISSDLIVDYLQDKSTGANINVPVGKIMCKINRHFVIAVGSVLHVSDQDTSGTYTGDAGATFAGIFDLRTSVVSGPTDIIGLSPFRQYLLVHFAECTIPVQFTEVTSPTPVLNISNLADFGGALKNYGNIAARTVQDLGEVALACDVVGVQSVQLQSYTQILSPDRPSRLIDPLIKKRLDPLGTEDLFESVFSQYDRLNSVYQLFIPDATRNNQRETRGFGYKLIDDLDLKAWNTYSGWNWSFTTRSTEGIVFFGQANSNNVFIFGNEDKFPLYADFIGDQETFSDGTVFTDGLGLSPISDINTSGVPIRGIWEMPWSDMKSRATQKTSRFITLDTEGTASFTVKMFIDEKYNDEADMGEMFTDNTLFTDDLGFIRYDLEPQLTYALSKGFVGKDYQGFGQAPFGDIFGGGTRTKAARSVPFPSKFQMFKLRFEVETMSPLKIIGITPNWMQGSIRRNSDE